MRTPFRLGLLLSLSLAAAACGSRATPPPTTPTPAPAVAAADVAGSYRSGGTCHTGTPENPTCTSRLTLAADGTGEFVGDDIVEAVTWTARGDAVDVVIGQRTLALTRAADGSLVEARGITWSRAP